jgi:hypothetical protein
VRNIKADPAVDGPISFLRPTSSITWHENGRIQAVSATLGDSVRARMAAISSVLIPCQSRRHRRPVVREPWRRERPSGAHQNRGLRCGLRQGGVPRHRLCESQWVGAAIRIDRYHGQEQVNEFATGGLGLLVRYW